MAITAPMARPTTRRVAITIVLAALAVALSSISIPVGPARLSPTQHLVNVLAAVLVGPWWGLAAAVVASVVRNATGLGMPLAFPGSMIGVVVAGLLYQASALWFGRGGAWLPRFVTAAVGEVIGTGLIGATVGALLVAPYIQGRTLEWSALILPFVLSSLSGAVLGVLGAQVLRRAGFVE